MIRNEARKLAISPAPSLPLFSISLPPSAISDFTPFSYLYYFHLFLPLYSRFQKAMQLPQPHISTSDSAATAAAAAAAAFDFKSAKRRGSYNCGRCGLPKKGHVCQISSITTPTSTSTPTSAPPATTSSSAARSPLPPPPRQSYSHLRRALSFDDFDIRCESPELNLEAYDSPLPCTDPDPDDEVVSGRLTVGCLWEVLRRLPPSGLLAAARVCKEWRETTKRLWRAADELKLMVPPKAQLRFIGSLLQKCPSLVRLSLKMERFGSKLVSNRSRVIWIESVDTK